MSITHRIARWTNLVRSQLSLWMLLQASGLFASFALPAWGARSMEVFAAYAPLSWIAAGFAGMLLFAVAFAIYQWGIRIRVNARYDAKRFASGVYINPLHINFFHVRILLNDFVLPSHPLVEGKTFIDCEIIGPANIYFERGNQAQMIRDPKFDAVYLDPAVHFQNGFIFRNCTFVRCSFQRITLFVSHGDYGTMAQHPMLNWISHTPASFQRHLEEGFANLKTMDGAPAAVGSDASPPG